MLKDLTVSLKKSALKFGLFAVSAIYVNLAFVHHIRFLPYRLLLSLVPWTVLVILWWFQYTSSQIVDNLLWEISNEQ